MSVKNKKANIFMKVIIIIGVLIIPLLYSYFYLSAFWDPYARLEDVPVAVVNLDEGAQINNEPRNIGNEICENLKEDGSLKFIFTDEEDADNGVLGKEYYAAIIIPKDFSECASTVSKDTEKLHGSIIYKANQKKNYLASQIIGYAMPTIKESVNASIDEEIINTLCDKLNSVPDEMGVLQDGFNQLLDGSGKLTDAASKLSNGAEDLLNGSSALLNGSQRVTSGSSDLKNGLSKLQSGTSSLEHSAPALGNGIQALNAGANELNSGLATIAKNNTALNSGAAQLSEGSITLNDSVAVYTQGVSACESGASKLTDGIKSAALGVDRVTAGLDLSVKALDEKADNESLDALDNGVDTLNSSVNALDANYTKAMEYLRLYQQTGADAYLNGAVQYFEGIEKNMPMLTAGTESLRTNVKALTNGMREVKTNTALLQEGMHQLQNGFGNSENPDTLLGGAEALNKGLNTLTENNNALTEGAAALAKGADNLNGGIKAYTDGVHSAGVGASKLADGTNELNANVPALTAGIKELSKGADQLTAGSKTLNNGSSRVTDGAKALNEGMTTLKNGTDAMLDGTKQLDSGIHTAADGVDNSILETNSQLKALAGLAEYGAEPITTESEYIQPVANYGSAFAPYFMGLSLWVGGLMIFFGIYLDYGKKIKSLTKDSDKPLIREISFLAISSLQGIALAFVIQVILGITVNNPLLLYFSCWITSLAFMSIVQFCIINLGNGGKFIALLLLILQLTSCAGTFPIETQSAFFQTIFKILPMSYSTLLFKEAISGTAGNEALRCSLVLLAYFGVFMIISGLCHIIKAKKSKRKYAELTV